MITILYGTPIIRKAILLFENLLFRILHPFFWGKGVTVFGLPIVSFARGSEVHIGRRLVIISHPYFSEPGINHPVVLRTLSATAKLVIGDNVGISGGGICSAAEVVIGNNVMMGANAFVADTDFHATESTNRRYGHDDIPTARVVIEDNVFIGMNSLVLKGTRIGANSVIAAGSVVTSNIPPNSIAGGIPARVIRRIEDKRI